MDLVSSNARLTMVFRPLHRQPETNIFVGPLPPPLFKNINGMFCNFLLIVSAIFRAIFRVLKPNKRRLLIIRRF